MESPRLLHEVQEIAGVGVYVLDVATGRWRSSEILDRLFGIRPAPDHAVDEWVALIHPDDRQMMMDYFAHEVVDKRQPFNKAYRIIRPDDGAVRWLQGFGMMECDAQDRPVRMIGTIQDITDCKRTEDALRESTAHLEERVAERTRDLERANAALRKSEALLNATGRMASVGGWELDVRTLDQVWTEEVYRIHEVDLGYQPTGPKGITFYAPAAIPIITRAVQRAIEFGEPFDLELEFITAKGNWRWVHAIGKADLKNGRIEGTFQDITERKRAEAAIREKNAALDQSVAQLRKLTDELTQAEERERKRVAEVLHDQLQQILVATTIKVGLIDRLAPEADHAGSIQAALDLLRKAIDISRSLTAELYPPILLDAGLMPGLKWLADWMQDHHGLAVRITGEEVPDAPEPLRILMFRAVREMLFNVVKHAGTNTATVHLEAPEAGFLRVVVKDHGRGFPPDILVDPISSGGLGLFRLRERLSYMGGTLELKRPLRGGARISITVPFNRDKPPSSTAG